MDGPEDTRKHTPHEFPVHYLDDRRFFRGYAVPVMTSDQIAAVHRRIVSDINGEYETGRHKQDMDRLAIRVTMCTALLLTVFEAVRLALGH